MRARRTAGVATVALALGAAALTGPATAEPKGDRGQGKGKGAERSSAATEGYEVWASDQSNSVSGAEARGVDGSFLWIWDSEDIAAQLDGGPEAAPVGCTVGEVGPCDLLDVFPQDLREYGADGKPTGNTLADLDGFGRLHGMLADPQQRYLTANIFAPGGGYVGIIDRRTKAAVSLFRVTQTDSGGALNRSVHMSFWNNDGSQVLVANLNGKVLERIDVRRNGSGRIKSATFDRSASLGVGKSQSVASEATVFRGRNQQNKLMLGRVAGSYDEADFGDLTPAGVCKENGCTDGPAAAAGGRPNNVIICPIPSDNGLAYVTMGGGGLLVADTSTTPMSIVGEYGNQVINGAGCGGVQTGDQMWLNAGVSASGAGADWSTYTVYTLDDTAYDVARAENEPAPEVIFRDAGNTATGGSSVGAPSNPTGQLPGTTTRRDSHGAATTTDESVVHMVDRIQNVVESFTTDGERSTYDLANGVCAAHAAEDVPPAYADDPAPDLMERTPDGKYLMIGLRGPAPVSVTHSAQGACPGVGIVELSEDGRTGELVDVLRSTNTVDTAPVSAPGGYPYAGPERSDIHAATVVSKR